MMKKTVLFTVLFLFFAFFIYAQNTTDNTQKRGALNFGGGFSYSNNPQILGGHLEFGFNIIQGAPYIQNHFLFRAGGFSADDLESTILTLSEKILFGRDYGIAGVYAFLEGGAGFYNNSQTKNLLDSLVYSFGFGGGFEIGRANLGRFYIEAGYLGQLWVSNDILSGIQLQTGWRVFLDTKKN